MVDIIAIGGSSATALEWITPSESGSIVTNAPLHAATVGSATTLSLPIAGTWTAGNVIGESSATALEWITPSESGSIVADAPLFTSTVGSGTETTLSLPIAGTWATGSVVSRTSATELEWVASSGGGTVLSVSATTPIASSGGDNPDISLTITGSLLLGMLLVDQELVMGWLGLLGLVVFYQLLDDPIAITSAWC